jgi:dihydrofolate synthase/folylpolyglutamate synthase
MDKEKIAHPLKGLENPEIEFLKKLDFFGIKPGLSRINWLLKVIGNPQKKFRSIVVGGTNGKGSVATILFSLLEKNGYTAGLYTSPHLVSICERFRTVDGLISPDEFRRYGEKIVRIAGEEKLLKAGITYFEFTTAMAFKWFADKNVEIAVLEVGMGGRLDATNTAPRELSIITTVSMDHTQFLGKSIEKIAFEKAGIIKKNKPCITACKGSALRVLQKESIRKKARLFIFGRDFTCEDKGSHFDYHGLNRKFKNLSLNLYGSHQYINASLALAGAEILENSGFSFSEENVKRALKGVLLHGRFEVIRQSPLVLIDGAHNPSAIRTLADTLKEVFPGRKIHVIFGAMKDKDIKGMLKILVKICRDFYISAIPVERAEKPERIKKLLDKRAAVFCFDNVHSAYKYALERSEKEHIICITGSFYLLGEFLRTG